MRPCFTASSRNMPELPTVLQRARACERVRGTRGHALMTHPVNPRSFGMKFIALAHVTTYTRPPFYSLGGLGTRLAVRHALDINSGLINVNSSHSRSVRRAGRGVYTYCTVLSRVLKRPPPLLK